MDKESYQKFKKAFVEREPLYIAGAAVFVKGIQLEHINSYFGHVSIGFEMDGGGFLRFVARDYDKSWEEE